MKAFCNPESTLQKWEGSLHYLIERKRAGMKERSQLEEVGAGLPCFCRIHLIKQTKPVGNGLCHKPCALAPRWSIFFDPEAWIHLLNIYIWSQCHCPREMACRAFTGLGFFPRCGLPPQGNFKVLRRLPCPQIHSALFCSLICKISQRFISLIIPNLLKQIFLD